MAFRDTPAMRLRGAYLTMHRRFQRLFRGAGATADQFVLLSLLIEEDDITQKELVDRSFSDPNTIAAMLRRMERGGLVLRRPHPTDGRAVNVRLTDAGRALHGRLVEVSLSLHHQVEATLSDAARPVLLDWLRTLATTMDRAAPPTD